MHDKITYVKKHTKPTNSAVFSYIEQCKICQNHNSNINCFEVIKFCKNLNVLLQVEAIMIKNTNPKRYHQLCSDN